MCNSYTGDITELRGALLLLRSDFKLVQQRGALFFKIAEPCQHSPNLTGNCPYRTVQRGFVGVVGQKGEKRDDLPLRFSSTGI